MSLVSSLPRSIAALALVAACLGPLSARAQSPGRLVITEVLSNPGGTISDANGEWFEIYNPWDTPIDIQNWFVQDSAASGLRPYHKIATSLVVPAKGFVVLGNSSNTTSNGGVAVTYSYGAALSFANSLDKIRLVGPTTNGRDWNTMTDSTANPAPESVIVDRIRYASAAISAQNGVSRTLKSIDLDNHDMDGSNWEDASVVDVYGPGGRGTPGAPGTAFLPVELVSFTAVLDGRDGVLAWETASESGNAGFQIEHLAPGATGFRRVAFLPGRGTTAEATRYDHRIAALAPGRHAFRLRQTDLDGTATLSPVTELAVGSETAFGLSAPQPNPARGSTYVVIHSDAADAVRLRVLDMLGREVAQVWTGDLAPGARQALVIDTSALANGRYVVRAEGRAGIATRPLVVAR